MASDVHHGVTVADPYRWLEDGKDPEVQAWGKAQDARTRAWLGSLPYLEPLRAEVRRVVTAQAARYDHVARAGGLWFAAKTQPPRQQPFVVTLASLDDAAGEKVVLDPGVLDPAGTTSIDFFEPSHDGRLLAVSLSRKGSEAGDLHLFEVATGKELPDRIPRVNGGTAGGGVAWNADGTGLWYTRYPREGERPAADLGFHVEVWFHRLGTPESADVYELGREFDDPRIAEHFLQSSEDGRVLSLVQKGDGREFALYLRRPEGGWRKVAGVGDGVVAARLGGDGGLWLLSRQGAPRGKLLRLSPDEPELSRARLVATAAEGAIVGLEPGSGLCGIEVTRSRVYLTEVVGGPSVVRVLDLDGKPLGRLEAGGVGAIAELRRAGPDEVVYGASTYLEPRAWMRAGADLAPRRIAAISVPSPVDFSDVEVLRETATSKDGTPVPMTILRRKGAKRDGKAPALLTAYGSYGINNAPGYRPGRRVLLDQGFTIAIANIRGGGEFGDEWHRAGSQVRKQNGIDDLAACARHLVARGYTSRARLALQGGSAGGLLMGAMITQFPDLARAVVAEVGIFDMIRVELHPNGAFNVTEFGTVKDPEQFRALHAYSPYHRVVDGGRYPMVLLTAGANDPRVDASHARKMAARLQAASRSGRPVLLRMSEFGHGIGTALDARIAEAADVYAFLLESLGVRWRAPRHASGGPAGAK
ncbi:MAG: S9 family peptidase [Deltaproteobacteria bacterium]|nr:S9 family peptidase [Deltaproteobacteria bacterium]